MTVGMIPMIICGGAVGVIVGGIVTMRIHGWKRTVIIVAIAALCAFLFARFLYTERDSDTEKWNGGKCPKCEAPFRYAGSKVKDGKKMYFWMCDNCNKVIRVYKNFGATW